jgi:hypothetical protein
MKVNLIFLAFLLIFCVKCEKRTEKGSDNGSPSGSDSVRRNLCYPVKISGLENTSSIFLYDTMGRLLESQYTHWNPLVIIQKFNYDNEGKITEIVSNTKALYSDFLISYDLEGRIVSIINPGTNIHSIYEYNDDNQVNKVINSYPESWPIQYILEYSSGDDDNPVKVQTIDAGISEYITLEYDDYNRPFHNSGVNASLLNLSYDLGPAYMLHLTHNITKFTRYNGDGQMVEQINYSYTYNSNNLPVQKEFTFFDGERNRDITIHYQYSCRLDTIKSRR